MVSFKKGKVISRESQDMGMLNLTIEFEDGISAHAISYEELTGPVDVGDEVIANTTAVELGLGSGGYHFVLWNLKRNEWDSGNSGHIMKMRYTPIQFNVRACEEDLPESIELSKALDGMPVAAGELHSQLLPFAVAFKKENPKGKLVYIMTDGGALPISFSNTVRFLKNNGYIEQTVTCGHAFGGDIEAVNIFGALAYAREILKVDAAVVLMGPGIIGTGSAPGFSGIEQAIILNAVLAMGGFPVAIPRITFMDKRERHFGLSHHTITTLACATLQSVTVALPKLKGEKAEIVRMQLDASGISGKHEIREIDCTGFIDLLRSSKFQPTVMGRTVDDEPEFFMAAGAAGFLAARKGMRN